MKVTLEPSPPQKKVLKFPVLMRYKTPPETIVLFTSETKGVYLQSPGVKPGFRSDYLLSVYDESSWEFYNGAVTLENDK